MRLPSLDFDRWDYGVTRLILGAGLVLVPVLLLALPLGSALAGRPLTVVLDGVADPAAVAPAPRPGIEAVSTGDALVTFADPGAGTVLVATLPQVVVALAALLVLWPLLRLTGAIQRGEGFTDRAVVRLRTVGLTLLVAPWVHQAVGSLASSRLASDAFGTSPELVIQVTGGPLALSGLGLVVGVLAEALRQGRVLRDDVDGLV